jgi:IrrE N-terminal-like domain
MNKITVEEALAFAEENFPNAPERLVDYLEVEVKYSLLNCDGWCLQHGNRSIIRINSEMPDVRKRFTLAHELGHLIYGITSVVGEFVNPFGKKNKEEKIIDGFASKLLLPEAKVLEAIREIPVTAKAIQRLAKIAKVSQSTVALRVASLTGELGLNDASVVLYENDLIKWQWSETLRLNGDTPAEMLRECAKFAPQPARIPHEQNEIIVASFVENPNNQTKLLFLQLVNESDGFKKLREEQIRELEEYLFENDVKFMQSMAGRFGAFKQTAQNLFLDEAIEQFSVRILRNPELINLKRLKSEKGREYIKLKLEIWAKK